MKQPLILMGLAMLFLIPFVNADVLMPGTHSVNVNNVITNINDFPNYVFVAYGKAGDQPCMVGARAQVIGNEGRIPGYYKFCTVSVYAIKKTDFNESKLTSDIPSYNSSYESYQKSVLDFLNSDKSQEVISGVISYNAVSDSNPKTSETNSYNISLDKILSAPDKKDIVIELNPLLYVYIGTSIVAFVAIVLILVLRKRSVLNES
jgi:hypothetical protein